MKHTLALITALLLPLTCFARLGETKDQLSARYGKAFKEDGNKLYYKLDDLNILFILYQDKASLMMVSRGNKGKLSDKEIQTFLAENAAGSGFKIDKSEPDDPEMKYFVEPETKRVGVYGFSEGNLMIATQKGAKEHLKHLPKDSKE